MYKVFNSTSKGIFIDEYSSLLEPNKTRTISNCRFDIEKFMASYSDRCEIHSKDGHHICKCYGNISCIPESGEDGTTFTLLENSSVDV